MGGPISGKSPTSQQAKGGKGQQYMEEMWITKKVLLYIEDNLDKALTLEEIAEKTQLPLDQVQGICQVEIASQRSVHEQSHSHSRQR